MDDGVRLRVLPSSTLATIFMAPAPVQTSTVFCGFTKGDATATPKDNTNHAKTRRVKNVKWRSVRMMLIIVYPGFGILDRNQVTERRDRY